MNDFLSHLTPTEIGFLAAWAVLIVLWLVGLLIERRGKRATGTRAAAQGAAAGAAPAQRKSLHESLQKTRGLIGARLRSALGQSAEADAALMAIEESLLSADVGVAATNKLIDELRPDVGRLSEDELATRVKGAMQQLLGTIEDVPLREPPHVILVAGVNGVGKTTTIAKLARLHTELGRKVLLVAADTFRAAAADQLERWASRVGADLVRHQGQGDPSSVAYDGMEAAKARGADVVIVDTAGRLHVKENLLAELSKISRTIGRQVPGAPHECLLVIDATTGQNALKQARGFGEVVELTGVILTKLDGTAKGGAAMAVTSELGVPIRYVGYGESPEDFAVFDPVAFVNALFDDTPSAGAR